MYENSANIIFLSFVTASWK